MLLALHRAGGTAAGTPKLHGSNTAGKMSWRARGTQAALASWRMRRHSTVLHDASPHMCCAYMSWPPRAAAHWQCSGVLMGLCSTARYWNHLLRMALGTLQLLASVDVSLGFLFWIVFTCACLPTAPLCDSRLARLCRVYHCFSRTTGRKAHRPSTHAFL